MTPHDAACVAVPEAEALADRIWFTDHPDRRFRARPGVGGVWLIRRRGDVLLRVVAARPLPPGDTDPALAPAWFESADPDLLAAKARRRARKASGGRR
jgi:hypothetical protein